MKTIMAMYTGNEPQIGKSNQPFYFGEVPIVQSPIQTVKQAIELAREPILHNYIIQTSGGFFVTPQFAVGIMPGTSFMIVAIKDEVADTLLAGVDGYMVKQIDYVTYQRVLVQASREADIKASSFVDAIENAYLRFFAIDIEDLNSVHDRIQIVAQTPETMFDQYDCGLSLSINRMLPAFSLERILAAVAYFQEIAKELKVYEYSITVFLHTQDDDGEQTKATLYHEEKTRTPTDEAID